MQNKRKFTVHTDFKAMIPRYCIHTLFNNPNIYNFNLFSTLHMLADLGLGLGPLIDFAKACFDHNNIRDKIGESNKLGCNNFMDN